MITNDSWLKVFKTVFGTDWYKELYSTVGRSYESQNAVNIDGDFQNVFNLTDFENIKVVIIGGTPSNSLAERSPIMFNASNGVLSPSAKNFRIEIKDEFECGDIPDDLTYLLEQGVLLSYCSFTATIQNKFEHAMLWKPFIEHMLKSLNDRGLPCIYVFLGRYAQGLSGVITKTANQKVIYLPHPSPLSCYRGFYGSNVFKEINEFLTRNGEEEIRWY